MQNSVPALQDSRAEARLSWRAGNPTDPDSPGEYRFFKSLQDSRARVPTLPGRLEKNEYLQESRADPTLWDSWDSPDCPAESGISPTVLAQPGQDVPECPSTVGLNMPRLS